MGGTVLILAREEEEQRRLLAEEVKKETPLSFPSTSFAACLEEMETLPMITGHKVIVLQAVDQLDVKACDQLVAALARPHPSFFLYMTAASLPASHKLRKVVDRVSQIKEEKAWEREERLARWVMEQAAVASCRMAKETAFLLVKRVAAHGIERELEKLLTFVGPHQEVTPEAVRAVVTPSPNATLWQLGEAIFSRDFLLAWSTAHLLLEEGMQPIPLLAHLRTQCMTARKMLHLLHQEGKPAVAAAFPYLKGKWLEKKLATLGKYGLGRIERGMVLLFDTEIKVKSSTMDPTLLLELLLVRMIDDALSVA